MVTPLDLLPDCFVKYDTVKGINGKTHGVSKAIRPPKKPKPKIIHKLDSLAITSSSLLSSSLFFKSSFKAFVMAKLRASIVFSVAVNELPSKEISKTFSPRMQTSLHI